MAVCFFAVATVQIGGIQSTGLSDAELIRARNRVRLVSPDWVSPKGDLFEWLQAETRARMGVIALIWFGAIVIVTVKHFRVEHSDR
jgi:hypothetical protein